MREGRMQVMGQIATEDFQVIDNCLLIQLPEEIDHRSEEHTSELQSP